MICPHCQTENREGARFCSNCGEPFAARCPQCGAANAPQARFCDQCGHHLAGGAEPGPHDHVAAPASMRSYVPPELLSRLEAARTQGEMAGERRVVTILFCDVKGSTAAAGQLDPEEWAELMNGAFEQLIEPVYRYEGIVARLMGDAILAFFGAPIAHEDDPERGVLAGLEIQARVAEYRQLVRERFGIEFQVRVGINTGLVVVGEVGSDLRLEYTAMGDAVNLAARMEQTAAPGTVQITADTYRLVEPLFEFERLGAIEVKGKTEPVPAFRVLRRRVDPGHLRGLAERQAPLVGRERQMGALVSALDDLGQGRGGIVCLVGEAGLGKSRLLHELRSRYVLPGSEGVAPEGLGWSASRALSYEIGRPYSQFQQHLRGLCGIDEYDPVTKSRARLATCGRWLPSEHRDQGLRALAGMMALEPEDVTEPLRGEVFLRRLYAAMDALWRGWAAERPGVVVFDDLHWADDASVTLLRHLLSLTEREPLLFLCAFRPERQGPAWEIKQAAERDYPHRFQEIGLTPLSQGESVSLVTSLLAASDLPEEARGLILSKAEGNPFFVEEMVRALIDSGVLVPQTDSSGIAAGWQLARPVSGLDLPDNLQGLLLARIDRLEEDVRRTLQLAAVIGRHFYYRVLKAIANLEDELDQHLSQLERLEMIHQAARVPELEFAFRHALTQEAAYRSILRKKRKTFHRQVAQTLENLFPERQDELAPIIGHHYAEGGVPDQARRYFTVAGDTAMRVFANAAALSHYTRALETTQGHAPVAPEELVELFLRRGRALELLARFEEALENYRRLRSVAEERHDQPMLLAALTALGTAYAVPTPVQNPVEGRQVLQEALQLARRLEDRVAEAKILWNLMILNVYSGGDVGEAQSFGERSLHLARSLDLKEQLAYTLNDIWYVYIASGQTERGQTAMEEARRLWEELENQPMLTDNLATAHAHYYYLGDFEQSLRYGEQAYQMSRSIENQWSMASSLIFMGQIHFEYGEAARAIPRMEEAIALSEEVGHPGPKTGTRADLGWYLALFGQPARGLELAQQGYAASTEIYPLFQQWVLAVMTRIHLLVGDLEAAEASFAAAAPGFTQFAVIPIVPVLEYLTKAELLLARRDPEGALETCAKILARMQASRWRANLTDLLLVKARAEWALGRAQPALASLKAAQSQAERRGSRRALWQILTTQADWQMALGSEKAARATRAAARQVVTYLIQQAAGTGVQGALRSLPQVASLL